MVFLVSYLSLFRSCTQLCVPVVKSVQYIRVAVLYWPRLSRCRSLSRQSRGVGLLLPPGRRAAIYHTGRDRPIHTVTNRTATRPTSTV